MCKDIKILTCWRKEVFLAKWSGICRDNQTHQCRDLSLKFHRITCLLQKHTCFHKKQSNKTIIPSLGKLKWSIQTEKQLILLQSQVLTAGGATGRCGWRSLHSHRGRDLWIGMKLNWNQRSCYSLMPKKVCVMCFFLPQVHRHKAQAQFPSFNRVARISLFVPFLKIVPVQETSRVTMAEVGAAYIRHLWHGFCFVWLKS